MRSSSSSSCQAKERGKKGKKAFLGGSRQSFLGDTAKIAFFAGFFCERELVGSYCGICTKTIWSSSLPVYFVLNPILHHTHGRSYHTIVLQESDVSSLRTSTKGTKSSPKHGSSHSRPSTSHHSSYGLPWNLRHGPSTFSFLGVAK